MPTYSTTSMPAAGPSGRRHAAPDRDRVGTFLTASWAALHVGALSVLGLGVHEAETGDAAPMSASAPDQPLA